MKEEFRRRRKGKEEEKGKKKKKERRRNKLGLRCAKLRLNLVSFNPEAKSEMHAPLNKEN